MSPSSPIPSSGPNDSIPAYPPVARVKTDKQPTTKAQMSLRPGQETGAERLRGGCIPCPVRATTVTALCRLLTIDLNRMEGAASASRSPAADRMNTTPTRRQRSFSKLRTFDMYNGHVDHNRFVTICNRINATVQLSCFLQ